MLLAPPGGRGNGKVVPVCALLAHAASQLELIVSILEAAMLEAAEKLEFEKAADLRDRVDRLKALPEGGELSLEEAGAPRTAAGKAGSSAGKTRGRQTRNKKSK